jgi:hypothetical protein
MKTRFHAPFFRHGPARDSWTMTVCHHLDHAIAPLGTVSLVLGLAAAALGLSALSNYLMATGLLFHLTVWFARWLESVRRPGG